jgi:predicted TIM-barrel fold metal-dependent hydrolase
MLQKPNTYLDFSGQSIVLSPQTLAGNLREWLELYPEKVLFATDAYPYSPQMGWEEFGSAASRAGRQALTLALTGMVRDGVITRARASELARMVLRENARKLYGL